MSRIRGLLSLLLSIYGGAIAASEISETPQWTAVHDGHGLNTGIGGTSLLAYYYDTCWKDLLEPSTVDCTHTHNTHSVSQ